eukprot:463432-Prymnesium_polylepis.1
MEGEISAKKARVLGWAWPSPCSSVYRETLRTARRRARSWRSSPPRARPYAAPPAVLTRG